MSIKLFNQQPINKLHVHGDLKSDQLNYYYTNLAYKQRDKHQNCRADILSQWARPGWAPSTQAQPRNGTDHAESAHRA
jgi:hypothetical protein